MRLIQFAALKTERPIYNYCKAHRVHVAGTATRLLPDHAAVLSSVVFSPPRCCFYMPEATRLNTLHIRRRRGVRDFREASSSWRNGRFLH